MDRASPQRAPAWRLRLLAAAAAVVLPGCGGADDGGAAAPPSEPAAGTSSAEPASPSPEAPSTEPGEGAPGSVELDASCTNPAGFVVHHPADWTVNPGEVVPSCSRFAPGEMTLREATDVRVAAIALSVEPVAFERVTAQRPDETARAELTVDGQDAVRIERVTRDGLYPTGTPLTTYAVRLDDDEDGPRTLVADTIGLPGADHERNVDVLDAMVRRLELDGGA